MVYNPLTDFLALSRLIAGSAVAERMPGLDYVMAALARANFITLSVGQTPPTSNQPTTVWLKPSLPSWVAEGTVYLWNASVGAYQVATPTLWQALLSPSGYLFQSVTGPSAVIGTGTTIAAVQRAAPAATTLQLPNLIAQWSLSRALKIADFSTAVVNHAITLVTADGSTIMRAASWQLLSTADQLAGITLHAVPDLNGWVIAP